MAQNALGLGTTTNKEIFGEKNCFEIVTLEFP